MGKGKSVIDLRNVDQVLHVIRNPVGWSNDAVREARLAAANEIERLRTENKAWRDYVQGMCVGASPVVAIAPTTGQATIVLVTPNK